MPGRIIAVATLVLLAVTLAVLVRDRAGSPQTLHREAGSRASDLSALLSTDDGFARAHPDRALRFPSDHGAHRDHRVEWWYLSGTLDGAAPQPLGFQLALMRIGLAAGPDERPSRWAASAAYAGFLTVTAPDRDGPLTGQRVARDALDLAAARSNPIRIHIEDWRLEQPDADGGRGDWRLEVAGEGVNLTLDLRARKPVVTPGTAGNRQPPFRFYLQPRLRARGTLDTGARRATVSGPITLEHAWGELPLPGGPVARDRFTLHLDNGRELLLLRTHRAGEAAGSSVSALLVDERGQAKTLSDADVELTPGDEWSSQRTDARYPVRWTLRIPGEDIEATVTPYANAQEVITPAPAWAGPVRLRGVAGGHGLKGTGFMQLSGYADTRGQP